MEIKQLLKKEIENFKIEPNEKSKIDKIALEFKREVQKEIKKKKIKAEVFIGGSLAKGNLIKKSEYDIDIFVRFSDKYKEEELSEKLEKILENFNKTRIHGSRDYFKIVKENIILEVIPTVRVKKAKDARNVTDLSYFHVSYILGKIRKNKKIADEILLMKGFCYGCNAYGAESYIKGFSGYAVELLMSYYESFVKFLKEVVAKDKLIIDAGKFYKNKEDVMNNLNESKLSSPIIFVDPTFKERNALAALGEETFSRFKKRAKEFLKNPSERFFIGEKINEARFNFILEAETDRQEGDIAGSKLLKFFNFITRNMERYFEIKKNNFEYLGEKKARYYFSVRKKENILFMGPPVENKQDGDKFKKAHKKIEVEKGRMVAREKNNINEDNFLLQLNRLRMIEMGIVSIERV